MKYCVECGVEIDGRASFCPSCSREKKLAYGREYMKRSKKKTIRINSEDYLFIKIFALDENVTIHEAVHRIIMERN